MIDILIAAVVSFVIAYLAIPVVIHIADVKKLFDIPDERKLHKNAIASLGGIGIFLGFISAGLIFIPFSKYAEFQYFLAASFIIFFIGLKDDLVLISATKKLIAQIIVAAIIIHLGGIRIDSLHGIFGIYEIPEAYGILLTYIIIILIINAFNLIDGIDGLAGSLSLFVLLLLGSYFYLANMPVYTMFALALAGGILAFLIFNFQPAKIFMGDSGALLLGTISAILVLKFINVAGSATSSMPVASSVALGVSIIIIPIADTLRVFSIRIFKGRSPFSPDRNHIHHLLVDRGLNHSAVTLICLSANIALVALTYTFRNLGNTVLLLGLFTLSFSVMGYLYFTLPKRKLVWHKRYVENRRTLRDEAVKTKIINLNVEQKVKSERF
ncbi:MAG: MraY family glycosyltransferase [Niabella sp.]